MAKSLGIVPGLGGLLLVAVPGHPQVADVELPDGFEIEAVVLGPFSGRPVGFELLPDGRILMLEKEGVVRIATPGSTASEPILSIPDVDELFERGLLGVVADPDWPVDPYVYLYYTPLEAPGRVVRYTASGALDDSSSTDLVLDSPYLVLEVPNGFPNHKGGTLRFGPDGMLWFATGDDLSGCIALEWRLPLGKMFRIDVSRLPATGTGPPPDELLIPPENPFPGPNFVARITYAVGFRNPFRFTIDPETHDVFVGDVGEEMWEEIDVIRSGLDSGASYGWPHWEGYEEFRPDWICTETHPVRRDPVHVYPHEGGTRFPVYAVIGGPVYRHVQCSDGAFPAEYDGDYFFTEFYNGWIRRLTRTESGDWVVAPAVAGQPGIAEWARGDWFISEFRFDSGGTMVLVNSPTGPASPPAGVYRIRSTAPGIEIVGDCSALPGAAVTYPNPVRGFAGVHVRTELAAPGPVSFEVFDVAGRGVHSDGRAEAAGIVDFRWDGLDRNGRRVPAGVYVYRIRRPGEGSARGRIVLLP